MSFSFVVRPGPSPPPPREPPRLVAFRLRPGPATPKLSRPSAQPAEPRNRAVFRYKLRPNSGLYFNPVEQLQRFAAYFFAAAFRLVFLVVDFLAADFPAGALFIMPLHTSTRPATALTDLSSIAFSPLLSPKTGRATGRE